MQTKKRFGALGAGGHGRDSHFAVHEDVQLVAVYDPKEESLRATAQRLGYDFAVCASAEELLAREDLDAVLIMTPDEEHPKQLEMAVQAGKPVLCEKPLAIDAAGLAVVRRSLGAADRQGLLVECCFPRQHQDADLPYAWVKHNLSALVERFGRLWRIGMNSIYSQPAEDWKQQRSFLLDKYVHDIRYKRYLLGDRPFVAERLTDGPDHYEVEGSIEGADGLVTFLCQGTRLHSGKTESEELENGKLVQKVRGEFIEIIMLNFTHGSCVVYTKTGLIRLYDRRTGELVTKEITPMKPEAYARMFRNVTRDFLVALDGGLRMNTVLDLWSVTESTVALAGPAGTYEYS